MFSPLFLRLFWEIFLLHVIISNIHLIWQNLQSRSSKSGRIEGGYSFCSVSNEFVLRPEQHSLTHPCKQPRPLRCVLNPSIYDSSISFLSYTSSNLPTLQGYHTLNLTQSYYNGHLRWSSNDTFIEHILQTDIGHKWLKLVIDIWMGLIWMVMLCCT